MRYRKILVALLSMSMLMVTATATAANAAKAVTDPMAKCPAFVAWIKAHHKPSKPRPASKPSDPVLRNTLLAMLERDQAARHAVIRAMGKDDQKVWVKKLVAVDAANLKHLAPMLDAHGFPTPAMVGRDGMQAAFILVQHADRDPALQARVLPQLAKLRAQGVVSGQDFALLTDRVLRAQGKPQRYGTQFRPDKAHGGINVPQPMEDPAHVDARRASVGLPPLKDYACVLSAVYHQPVSVDGSKPAAASGKAH